MNVSLLPDYRELTLKLWREIMSKKSLIAVCLLGLAWAGTAQAGFLGNNLELQFLQNLAQSPVSLSDGLNLNVGGNTGLNVDVGNTTLGVTVPTGLAGPVGLSFVDVNNSIPTIIGATGSGNGDVSFGPNSVTVLNLSPGSELLTVTVPEPGAFDLVALGLMILGMTVYQRAHAFN
jgi:hypothetical protein